MRRDQCARPYRQGIDRAQGLGERCRGDPPLGPIESGLGAGGGL